MKNSIGTQQSKKYIIWFIFLKKNEDRSEVSIPNAACHWVLYGLPNEAHTLLSQQSLSVRGPGSQSWIRTESGVCTAWGAVPLFWDFTLGMGQKRTAPKVTTASSWPSGNHSEAFRWLYGNGEINLQNVPLRSLTVLTEYLQIATSFYCVESPQNPCPPETSECAWHK